MIGSRRTMMLLMSLGLVGALPDGPAHAQTTAQEVYQLVQVAGQSLPVATEEEGDCRDELHAATLTLDPDGRWTLVTSELEICGADSVREEDREAGIYRLEGQTIRFLDEDGDPPADDDDDSELEVDDLLEGTRYATELRVRVTDGETELLFRR